MKFLIIGGDKRILKLKSMFEEDRHKIETFALYDNQINDISLLENILNNKFDYVIGPVPFTKDGENLNTEFIKNKIDLDTLLPYLKGQILIAGPLSEALKSKLEKYSIKAIDIMESEELVIYNTIATAEGTIKIAIENTEKNLHESKILILGFGRVAKTLALKLKGLCNQITCSARKLKDFAWIDTLGFSISNINNLNNLKDYDVIINTVPQIILTEEKLQNITNDTLIIDLASKPGGVDTETVKSLNLKYIWALALPGKVAPISSAKYIKDAIYNIIKT